MKAVVYLSTAIKPFSKDELLKLLKTARRNNKKRSVTGLLLYHDQQFIQAMEGDDETIDKLFEFIKQDPRHHNILKIYDKEIQERTFGDWSMGFKIISDDEAIEIPGFSNFLKSPMSTIGNAQGQLNTILQTFRSYIR